MNVLVFGATGMVGQGVLRECLLDPDVERVQTVGRSTTGVHHPKLREILHRDLSHYAEIESDLAGFDACFFSLGVSSAGMKEEEYERVTFGITLAAAETLCRLNPQMKFFCISGAGTDSTEQGRPALACRGSSRLALASEERNYNRNKSFGCPICPDFLRRLVALIHSMRLSLMKGAHADLSSTAWQEIGVKPYGACPACPGLPWSVPWGLSGLRCLPHSFVIRTGATCPGVPWKRSGGTRGSLDQHLLYRSLAIGAASMSA